MRNFTTLRVWQKSHALTLRIYAFTRSFPNDELFGLVSQMRRASASIATNIAEGCGRFSNSELKRFLVIAAGSSSELQYHLLLSRDLGYISEPDYQDLIHEVIQIRKMLYTYSTKL